MERSLSLKVSEKEETPPHPDDNRSTKKVKIRDQATDSSDALMLPCEQYAQPDEEKHATNHEDIPMLLENEAYEVIPEATITTKPVSFRDKLLNKDNPVDEDDDIELDARDVTLGREGIFLSVSFSPRVHRILEESMKFAVILKLLGRPIDYGRLRDNLLKLWRFTAPFRLLDLEGGCFIAYLANENDYQRVLIEGPWMITGHYLIVHPWSPEFSPINHSISQVVAWIRIPGLPTKYYKKSVIRAIGRTLGQVIRIDYNTASSERGKFARMAIILDLSHPLTSKIIVDDKALLVEYEGLPTICYHCGRYGHLAEACPMKQQTMQSDHPPAGPLELHSSGITNSALPACGINAANIKEDNPYGD